MRKMLMCEKGTSELYADLFHEVATPCYTAESRRCSGDFVGMSGQMILCYTATLATPKNIYHRMNEPSPLLLVCCVCV